MSDTAFTVKGTAGAYGDIEIGWADGVFDDRSGRTQLLIATGEIVCASPTGPCYAAAAAPGYVALLTALHALDKVTDVIGGEKFAAELVDLTALPDGATA